MKKMAKSSKLKLNCINYKPLYPNLPHTVWVSQQLPDVGFLLPAEGELCHLWCLWHQHQPPQSQGDTQGTGWNHSQLQHEEVWSLFESLLLWCWHHKHLDLWGKSLGDQYCCFWLPDEVEQSLKHKKKTLKIESFNSIYVKLNYYKEYISNIESLPSLKFTILFWRSKDIILRWSCFAMEL